MGHQFFRVFGLLFCGLLPLTSQAVPEPLRDVAGLTWQSCQKVYNSKNGLSWIPECGLVKPMQETAYRVKTARVVLADYELIRRDFPEVSHFNELLIDQWLLKHAAYLSGGQIERGVSADTNETIDADMTCSTLAYRPVDYGRALVFKVGENAFIDAKGAGTLYPRIGDHSNGLGTLREMIREFAFEKLIHRVFAHSRTGLDTVEGYAVINFGFSVNDPYEGWTAAGLYLRQAHTRHTDLNYFQLKDEQAKPIERVLRRYGMTSAAVAFMDDPTATRGVNIQGSEQGAVVDFGTLIAVDRFRASVMGMTNRGSLLFDIHSPDFVQPDPALQVSVKSWGIESVDGRIVDHSDEWISKWARWISNGTRTKAELMQFVHNLLDREENHWRMTTY